MRIIKRIPSGAGLGGGSSDAAAVLRALYRYFEALWQGREHPADFSRSRLSEIGLRLGADVPYLLRGGLAMVRGIGEEVTPLPGAFLHGLGCALIVPRRAAPTQKIYEIYRGRHPVIESRADPDLAEFAKRAGEIREPVSKGNCSELYARTLTLISNDLTEAVCAYVSEVQQALDRLKAEPGILGSVTGSGSAIFAVPKRLDLLDKSLLTGVSKALAGLPLEIVPITLFAKSCW